MRGILRSRPGQGLASLPRPAMASLKELREINRLRLLEVLQRAGSADRAELVRLTGLSRATVSARVAECTSRGLIVEDDERTAADGRGRRSARLRLDLAAGTALGADSRLSATSAWLWAMSRRIGPGRATGRSRCGRRSIRGARHGGRAGVRGARRGGHRPRAGPRRRPGPARSGGPPDRDGRVVADPPGVERTASRGRAGTAARPAGPARERRQPRRARGVRLWGGP